MVVLSATMGNIDGNLQANGAQVANDIAAGFQSISDHSKTTITRVAIASLTVLAAGVAALQPTHLVTLAIMSYQGIVQLAVPQFFGIWWRRGSKAGALGGMIGGFGTACVMQGLYSTSIPWLAGLTSGVAGLIVNVFLYVILSYVCPSGDAERARSAELFEGEEPLTD